MSSFPEYLNKAANEIDAAMYSGDVFADAAIREELDWYLARWRRGLNEWADRGRERAIADAFEEGVEAAARLIDKRLRGYVDEHGRVDPETGVTEFPGDGEEYTAELDEIAETIRGLAKGDDQ